MIIAGAEPLVIGAIAPSTMGIWDQHGKWQKQPFYVLREATQQEWVEWWTENSSLPLAPDPRAKYFYLISVD